MRHLNWIVRDETDLTLLSFKPDTEHQVVDVTANIIRFNQLFYIFYTHYSSVKSVFMSVLQSTDLFLSKEANLSYVHVSGFLQVGPRCVNHVDVVHLTA